MSRFADIERRVARAVHERLHRDYRCFANGPDGDTVDVRAQFQDRIVFAGDEAGNDALLDLREQAPRLVFSTLVDVHQPKTGSVYVQIIDGELDPANVFRVRSVDPSDGSRVVANCIELLGTAATPFVPQ